ncbi:protein kinase family protein [Photobacterium sp. BZF1]|uniref:protein kinase domain-containing protein n=1 Tax=Photobacterium sp. BZF1 TaxID=1904457 RepID=UPI001653E382|nr:protein kinase [Photobacterium sp. BZF1]MBC7006528.1 protein kinase family protein [Photobacterium sp. BZF1]
MIESVRSFFGQRAGKGNVGPRSKCPDAPPLWLMEQLAIADSACCEVIGQNCFKVDQSGQAIKATIKIKYGETPTQAYLLQREADWLTRLYSLNLTRSECIKFYKNGQQSYLLTNYLSGLAASHWLREQLAGDEETVYLHQLANYLESALDQLEAIHSNGFVHGDIKPSNIIFAPNCIAELIDFSNMRRIGEPWLERGFKQFSPSYFNANHSSTATTKQDYYAYLMSMKVLFELEKRTELRPLEGFESIVEQHAESGVISTGFKNRILAMYESL